MSFKASYSFSMNETELDLIGVSICTKNTYYKSYANGLSNSG